MNKETSNFFPGVHFGCIQTRGKTKGPKQTKPITIDIGL